MRRLLHQSLAAEGAREGLGQHREIARRLRVAPKPAEDRLHRPGAAPEHVVVEAFCQLERGSGVVEPCPEASCPRQPRVNDRLQRRTRGRLAQGLLEELGRTVNAFQLGQEDQRLGAPRADLRLAQQLGRDRPGARPLAGELMRVRLVVEQFTYATASTVVLVAAVLSALVVRQRINRLDLVAVLKTRD